MAAHMPRYPASRLSAWCVLWARSPWLVVLLLVGLDQPLTSRLRKRAKYHSIPGSSRAARTIHDFGTACSASICTVPWQFRHLAATRVSTDSMYLHASRVHPPSAWMLEQTCTRHYESHHQTGLRWQKSGVYKRPEHTVGCKRLQSASRHNAAALKDREPLIVLAVLQHAWAPSRTRPMKPSGSWIAQ